MPNGSGQATRGLEIIFALKMWLEKLYDDFLAKNSFLSFFNNDLFKKPTSFEPTLMTRI